MEQVVYLSEQWIDAASEALAVLSIEPGPSWSVGYRVTGGPHGSTAHQLVFDRQRVSVRSGSDGASLVLTLDWDLAVAVNQGAASAQGAFLDGRIQLSGDPGVLLDHQHELSAADERLVELRERTIYGPSPTH